MKLTELGYTKDLENYRIENGLESFRVGRVIAEHKERYIVKTEEKEYDSEIIGNLRFTATSRADFPAVGDWVAISEFNDNNALIHAIFPRKTLIERKAVGKTGEKQIIAANIDFALIVQAIDRDFNINRIERYLSICHTSIVLNKIDLINQTKVDEIKVKVQTRIQNTPVIAISNSNLTGIEELKTLFQKGKTYCLLGSSGVGKSTLSNILSGKEHMKTDVISQSTNKGRHITSHRELMIIDNGGILIDNPGMREVGIADSNEGIETTFDTIIQLAKNCRFADCTHSTETGCAVIEAVEKGELDAAVWDNYLRMEREKEHFESTVAEKRQKDKDFGKMVKNFKKLKGR
jgi:ribosome biogenesis GTPase